MRVVPKRSVSVAVVVVLAAVCVACGGSGSSATETTSPDQQKVTVAGDSIALGLGVAMRDEAEGDSRYSGVEVKAIGKDGTGLARPDRFDWTARLAELARDFPPDVLVFSVGSNDSQDLTDADGSTVVTMADSEGWDAEYSRRLAEVFADFSDTGTTVVWVGQIRPSESRVADGNRHINELAIDAAADRAWVQVADLAVVTGSGAEKTSKCLAGDGLHLSADCYAKAAEGLLGELPLT